MSKDIFGDSARRSRRAAMVGSGIVWDGASLDRFLSDRWAWCRGRR